LVRALSPTSSTVMDPFAGSGSAGIAACMDGRRFIGAETSLEFCEIAENRYRSLKTGALPYRPLDKAIWTPGTNDAVAQRPDHFVDHQ
jgi:16S rRNA G966 N2-methylase RsmD